MLDTREYNVVEIARFFNISPILLGDLSHTSYNDIEQAQIEFVQHTLLPIINLLEDEINRKLITNRNNYIDFDETQLLTGNKATLANYYSTLVSNAIITINEAREQLGWNSIDGADDLILPYSDVNQNTVNEQEVEEQNNI
jgi:HK97 family phage portal protein